jgi:hypothetical protein
MRYENEDQVISLRTMLFFVMRQWRKLILAGLILAVLLGGLQGFRTWRQVTDKVYLAQLQESYEQSMENYLVEKKAYDTKVEKLRKDIANQQEYLQDSLLMQMDYRNTAVVNAGIYISVSDEDVNVAATVAVAYRFMLKDSVRIHAMAEAMGMEDKHLWEMISMIDGIQNGSPMLTISVCYPTEEGAQKIMDLFLSDIQKIQKEVAANTCPHTVGVVCGGVNTMVDEDLRDMQEKEERRLSTYKTELENELKPAKIPVAPAAPTVGLGTVVKSAVLFAIIGGVLGVFAVAGWACLAYLLGDQVYSADEIQGRLGISSLGKLAQKPGKKCFVDRWLDRKERRAVYADAAAGSMVAANIGNHAQNCQPLLISSSADKDSVDAVVALLRSELPQMEIIWDGSILSSVEAVKKLPRCGSVLLVEHCGVSRYSEIARQAEVIERMDKKLIGVLTLEA